MLLTRCESLLPITIRRLVQNGVLRRFDVFGILGIGTMSNERSVWRYFATWRLPRHMDVLLPLLIVISPCVAKSTGTPYTDALEAWPRRNIVVESWMVWTIDN